MAVAAALPPGALAQHQLRNSENAALNGGYSLYNGKGKDAEDDGNFIDNIKTKVKVKTISVVILILGALTGGGIFLGASNSLLAPAFQYLTTYATDTEYAALTTRIGRIMKMQVRGVTTKNWKGVTVYSKMSKKFQNRLAANNIDIEIGDSGYKVLTFTQKSTNVSGGTSSKTITISADGFMDEFMNNAEFREAFMSAKRGRVASFFDKIADVFYSSRIKQTRNEFSDYKQTGDADVDDASFKAKMVSEFDGTTQINSRNSSRTTEEEVIRRGDGSVVTDGNGNPLTQTVTSSDTTSSSTTSTRGSFAEASQKASKWLEDFNGKVSIGVNVACGVLRVVNMINVMVAVNEISQSITYFMGFAEPMSKMMYGLGTESPVNATLNYLSTSQTGKIPDYNNIKEGSFITTEAYQDVNGQIEIGETDIAGSPLESNGLQMMLGGAPGDATKAKNYSLERVGNTVMRVLSVGGATAIGCAVADAALSIVSIAAAILSLGSSLIIDSILTFVLSTAVQITIPIILSFAIPAIAKALFTNIFENAFGVEAGEYIARGAAALNFRNGRAGGQSASSKEAVIAYNKTMQEVLALEAEVDRQRLSPFDITNPNTFFGNIAYSFLPVITTSKMTSISSFMRTVGKSISSIISPVHADGEGSSYITTFGECEMLETIGAVGDVYCNPISTTDLSTLDLDSDSEDWDHYEDLINQSMKSCEDDGSCELQKNSNLYKYFVYCSNRESPLGVVDQSILSDAESFTGNETIDNVLNFVPGVNDVMSVVNDIQDFANLDWASGARCVNPTGSTIEFADKETSPTFWEDEGKYYQRYVEDTRILEQMGAFEEVESPLLSVLDELEEKYKDETYTEYLARATGLNIKDVEGIIALAEVYQFTSEYDPTNRIAFEDILIGKSGNQVASNIKESKTYIDNDELVEDNSETVIENKTYIAYFNLRDRNYIV